MTVPFSLSHFPSSALGVCHCKHSSLPLALPRPVRAMSFPRVELWNMFPTDCIVTSLGCITKPRSGNFTLGSHAPCWVPFPCE